MGSRLKKSIGLLLITGLFLSSLGGCTSQSSKEVEKSDQKQTTKQIEESIQEEKVDEDKDIWPKVAEEPVELSIWINGRPEAELSPEMSVLKELQERTNVKLDFTVIPLQNSIELYNIYMSSGEYADITYKTVRELMQYVPNKIFAPYSDFLEEAPHLKEALEKYPQYWSEIQGPDKKLYVIPQILDLESTLITTYMIRKDWLDDVGLEPPTTIDEWYTVLKAFKDADPTRIPLTNRPAGTDRGTGWVKIGRSNYNTFAYAWGMDEAFYLDKADGKFKFGATEPKFIEYIEFLNKLYTEGLMEPEYLTITIQQWEERLMTNKSGATHDFYSRITRFTKELQKTIPEAKFIGVLPPVLKKGDTPMTRKARRTFNDAYAAAISAQSEHKIEALKFIDYLYTKEGANLVNHGIENEHYTLEDGFVKTADFISNSPDGRSESEVKCSLGMGFFPNYGAAKKIPTNIPEEREIRKAVLDYLNPPLFIDFTEEEKEIISMKMNEINTYMDEVIDKMIMGIEPLDKIDEFVNTLNKMGVEELLDIYQKAYERQY